MYAAKYSGIITEDIPHPHNDGTDLAGSRDCYELILDPRFAEFQGTLYIEWGYGKLAWVQRADKQEKLIVELRREFKEPEFPGFLNFIRPLSEVELVPASWITVLKEAKGVYLLTCPKTKELYVGSASGEEGFWSRWCQYIANNHGGNVLLKNREYSDFQVSILEVAGTAATVGEVLEMEKRWKWKLQSREMGLNRN